MGQQLRHVTLHQLRSDRLAGLLGGVENVDGDQPGGLGYAHGSSTPSGLVAVSDHRANVDRWPSSSRSRARAGYPSCHMPLIAESGRHGHHGRGIRRKRGLHATNRHRHGSANTGLGGLGSQPPTVAVVESLRSQPSPGAKTSKRGPFVTFAGAFVPFEA
jgi:hypothetical protein